ncbi:MAG: Aldose 1-epimerase [Luteibacter sp.]|uniref:aldose epimerase family protein n=1 Tax=Luteibacter sp. TaxID=1886636 RepID=UPI00137D55F4|nr:aldose epimerase family protein [Luteibacter sp.]KAF1004982.1 MAG: Aldose 1-epimerase [Luteibacter sp.]
MRRTVFMASLLIAMTAGMTVYAADAKRETFGALADGTKVDAVLLDSGHGVQVRVMAYGAGLQEVITPDRHGKPANILLGYAKFDDYLKKPQYFGATVGRYANRIAKGRFTLDGHAYQVPTNDGPNSLHGGTKGFDKVLWTIGDVKSGADSASVTLTYVSPDGDMGYPGKLTATATYTLDAQNHLTIQYDATTDKPTVVNLTNHAYWNLSGEGSGSVMDQVLTIPADSYVPVDATAIPLGKIAPVAGTPFDFRKGKPIGRDVRLSDPQLVNGRGFDHDFVVARDIAKTPRVVAKVEDPASGRTMTLKSTMPGVQFYSGNFLDATSVGTGGHMYREDDAFVLEPQFHPDTPNQPSFGSARLAPGETYRHTIVFEFGTK